MAETVAGRYDPDVGFIPDSPGRVSWLALGLAAVAIYFLFVKR